MIVHPHVHSGGPCAAPFRYHPQRHGATGVARGPACFAQRFGMESNRFGVARMVIGELPR
jgi:hypothetical protein